MWRCLKSRSSQAPSAAGVRITCDDLLRWGPSADRGYEGGALWFLLSHSHNLQLLFWPFFKRCMSFFLFGKRFPLNWKIGGKKMAMVRWIYLVCTKKNSFSRANFQILCLFMSFNPKTWLFESHNFDIISVYWVFFSLIWLFSSEIWLFFPRILTIFSSFDYIIQKYSLSISYL